MLMAVMILVAVILVPYRDEKLAKVHSTEEEKLETENMDNTFKKFCYKGKEKNWTIARR